MIDLWYSEFHSETIKFSVHVEKQILSKQSPFQRIDVFESKELGRFFTLDGLLLCW